MFNDLDIIVKQYPDIDILHVYAIGDTHIGSPEFDEDILRKKIDIIKNDDNAALVLCGDLADYGLKNSKTNIYKATLSIAQQKEAVYEMFKPVKDKIAALVPGNHEDRLSIEVGTCPMFEIACLWGIPEVYRENIAITKYQFGKSYNGGYNTFVGLTSHGSSKNKHHKFVASFDGIDFAIAGHTHLSSLSNYSKLRVNSRCNVVTVIPYKELIVDAHLKPGGYGLKKEYEPSAPSELQYFELSIQRENNRKRTPHKIINYHTIQLI